MEMEKLPHKKLQEKQVPRSEKTKNERDEPKKKKG